MKLVLGTAQLGFNYGIANKIGKPSEEEAFEIMRCAVENNIFYFDTAYSYGDSEIIIGKFLDTYTSYKNKVKIITKMPSFKEKKINNTIINNFFFESLRRLRQNRIYCYMVHNCNDIKNNYDVICDALERFKREGYIRKIGVSVYDASEAEYLLKNFDFDIIQLPVNIFDQRLLEDGSLVKLKKKGIEIYARSIFLQGLVFLPADNVPLNLRRALRYIEKLNAISARYNVTRGEIALLFVHSIPEIDKIVIGVEKVSQLQNNIEALSKIQIFEEIKTSINFRDFFIPDPSIVDPRNWTHEKRCY